MSLQDLKDQNILLPKSEWGMHSSRGVVAKFPLALVFTGCLTGIIITYLGNGEAWTWIGIILFFINFFGIIYLCDRGIVKLEKRKESERSEKES